MKLAKPIGIAMVVIAAQVCAFSAEVAVLRNGFEIRFERKEQTGTTTRLYMRDGSVEIATSEIASFEHEDTPDIPVSAPGATAVNAPAPASTLAPSAAPGAAPAPVTTAAPKALPAASRITLTPAELDLL